MYERETAYNRKGAAKQPRREHCAQGRARGLSESEPADEAGAKLLSAVRHVLGKRDPLLPRQTIACGSHNAQSAWLLQAA